MKFVGVLLSIILFTTAAHADELTGRVVGVLDGDTINVIDKNNHQYRIRFAGIDAPEKSQAFGQVSKKSLSDLVYDKFVTVQYNESDRYGRIIGKVIYDEQDINLEQVRRGLAWHYKQYQAKQSSSDREQYANAEMSARKNQKGLWQDANPTPPWDYRHNQ